MLSSIESSIPIYTINTGYMKTKSQAWDKQRFLRGGEILYCVHKITFRPCFSILKQAFGTHYYRKTGLGGKVG